MKLCQLGRVLCRVLCRLLPLAPLRLAGFARLGIVLLGALALLLSCNREPQEVRLDLNIVAIHTDGGEWLDYQPHDLYVPAGARVRVTLRNRSAAPSSGHNFVLVQPGSVELVASLAPAVAALPGHVPSHEAVIASSPLLPPGGEASFRFMAPTAGSYEFLCTEPGHAQLLRGRFIVQ